MRLLRAAFWSVSLSLFVPACSPAPKSDASAAAAPAGLSDADRAAILKADSAFGVAANAGAVDGVAEVYAEDATLLPPNEPAVKGRDAIRKYWGGFLDAYTVRFELGTDDLDGRGDLAYVRGHYKLTASPKAKGAAAFSEEGKFVEVFKRQADGSWRYVIDIYNSDQPPPK